MITIIPANQSILSILGKQHYTRDDKYRLSSFCLCQPVAEGTLMFNNLTKELLIVESPFSALDDSEYLSLIERWFFVEDSSDELKTSRELADIFRYSIQKRYYKSFTILPTTGCNARCFYCFEKGLRPQTMTQTTATQVAKFIEANSKSAEAISLRWFGGEPLLNIPAIDTICSILKSDLFKFSSSIVTNGYLFNEALVTQAIQKWNLSKVQITLDGTEATYNETKAYVYKNCNAYQTVLNNLLILCNNGIRLNIRLNIDEYNLSDMHALVQELSLLLPSKQRISITAVPLFEHAGATERPRSEDQREFLLQEINKLNQFAYSLGFNQNMKLNTNIQVNCCGADSKDSVVIMPNGDLIRCEHIVENAVHGNVYSNSTMSNGVWMDYCQPIDICTDCANYPTCYRLIGCEEFENCSPTIKKWRIFNLRERMIAEYERFALKKQTKSEKTLDISSRIDL